MNKNLETIHTMLEEDRHRWDCPDYYGVVIVHPDLVEDTTSLIAVEFPNEYVSLRARGYNEFKMTGGGALKVTSLRHQQAQENHAGMNYTSIMFSHTWLGGMDDLKKIPCDGMNTIGFMISRCRSYSKYKSKFVIM